MAGSMSYPSQFRSDFTKAVRVSLPYNTAQTFVVGSSVQFNGTTGVVDLASSVADPLTYFSMDSTSITGSDVVSSGKLPLIQSGCRVASSLFVAAGTTNALTVTSAHLGYYVQVASAAAGKWELTAGGSMVIKDVFVGKVDKIYTDRDGTVMAEWLHDPKIFAG